MIGEDYKTSTAYAFRVPLRDSAGALQTGQSPTVAVYLPDNSADGSPPSLTELGTTGVYRFSYTPATAGCYTFVVTAASCLTVVFSIQVRATERGDTYTRVGAPAGASIAADIAALPTDADVQTAAGAALTSYDPPTHAELTSGLAGLNDLSSVEAQAAAAAALTAYDPPTAAELTSGLAGLNDLSSVEAQAAAAAALTAYDPPTAAELTSAVSPLALEATLTAIKGAGWSNETLAAIDALIDAIKAKTDLIPASPAAVGSKMDLQDAPNAVALGAIADAVLDEEVNSATATGNSLRAAAKAAWAQGFGRWVISGTTLTLYGPDGSTPVRAFALDNAENPTSRTPA